MTLPALTPDQQAVVARVMAQPEDPDARMTVWELIAQKCERAGDQCAVLRNHYAFAGLPDEQLLLACRLGETSGDGIFMPSCLAAGVARRFASDAPAELALRLSLAARYEWLASQTNANAHPEELFRPLLHAAAAHDFAAVARIADLPPEALKKPNNPNYAHLLAALTGLIRGDGARLREAAVAMGKRRPPAYVKAAHRAVIAIADASPKSFADALGMMLKAYPKYVYDDEAYRMVDPHVTGLYELARLYRPEVVRDFDTGRPLPWDSGYHQWLLTCPDIARHFERERVPEAVRPHVVDLEPLAWGPVFLAKVRERMANPPDPRSFLRGGGPES